MYKDVIARYSSLAADTSNYKDPYNGLTYKDAEIPLLWVRSYSATKEYDGIAIFPRSNHWCVSLIKAYSASNKKRCKLNLEPLTGCFAIHKSDFPDVDQLQDFMDETLSLSTYYSRTIEHLKNLSGPNPILLCWASSHKKMVEKLHYFVSDPNCDRDLFWRRYVEVYNAMGQGDEASMQNALQANKNLVDGFKLNDVEADNLLYVMDFFLCVMLCDIKRSSCDKDEVPFLIYQSLKHPDCMYYRLVEEYEKMRTRYFRYSNDSDIFSRAISDSIKSKTL